MRIYRVATAAGMPPGVALKRGSLNIMSEVQKRRQKKTRSRKMTMESTAMRMIKMIGTVSLVSTELSEEAFDGGALTGGVEVVGGPGSVLTLGGTAVVVVLGATEVVVGTTDGTTEVVLGTTAVVVGTAEVVVVVVGTIEDVVGTTEVVVGTTTVVVGAGGGGGTYVPHGVVQTSVKVETLLIARLELGPDT